MNLKPAVVIPVDLFGHPANVDEITNIAHQEKIKVLVDAAQSFGGVSKTEWLVQWAMQNELFFSCKTIRMLRRWRSHFYSIL